MGQLGPSGMQGDRGVSVRPFFLSVLNIPRLPIIYAGNKHLTVFVACH